MARKGAKSGGAAHIAHKAVKSKKVESESDNDSDGSEENLMQFNKSKKVDSDEEEDHEVFNLAIDEDDDNEDDDEEDEEDEDEDDDNENSDDDDSEEDMDSDNELTNLVNNLPQAMKQKVLMKKGAEDSDDENSDEDEEKEESWGKKKSTWYNNDTADLEIGQEIADAEEEEEAAKELHKGKLARMKESDFYEEFGSDADSNSEEEETNMGKLLQQKNGDKKTQKKASKKLLKNSASNADSTGISELELVALGDSGDVQIEHFSRDLSKLTKDKRLELIAAQSPELMGIVTELKERISELKGTVIPLREFVVRVAETARVDDDVVEYLEVKQQLLLSYCVNVVFYLYMKAEGKSVRSHPVMKQLLKLRYVMEKMRSLDNKLKYQIDRLVKLSEMNPADLASHSSGLLRPNPSALLARDNDDSEEEEDAADSEDDRRSSKKSEVYRPPKMTAMPYKENESQLDKKNSKRDKLMKKIKNSDLMESLRSEFGTAPETSASGGISTQTGDLKALRDEQDERDKFEEERFVRMTMSRKDKKSIKRRTAEATRLDNFDDIGDVGDLEEIAKLTALVGSSRGSSSRMDVDDDDAAFSGKASKSSSSASALQRAVEAMSQSKSGKSKKAADYSDDDEDDQFGALLSAAGDSDKKRRRAPEGRMNGFEGGGDEDEDDDLVEEFGQKKKAYLAKKQEHYTAEPRYGGLVENVADGQKRAATYEIMKNRGLTPHRKKANRNPRVKKREAYAKAVISRKGQVRDVITGAAGAYAGEMTGIKANIARSRKLA